MRPILLHLLIFLLPFIGYAVFLFLSRRGTRFVDGPMFRLGLAGLALVALSLVSLATLTGEDPEKTYRPPVYKDGEVVPGGFE